MTSTITFDFTQKVYREALLSISLKQGKRAIQTVCICVILVAVISLYGYWLNGTFSTLLSWLPFLLAVIAFYFFALVGLPYWQARDRLNQNIFQKTTIECGETALILRMENGFSETVPYAHIVKSMHNDRYAFYWKNSVDAVILPQHAFPSLEAYREQVSAINDKLKC